MRHLFCVLAFCLLFAFAAEPTALAANPATEDFRGVWVSTVYQLDYPASLSQDPELLRQNADEILNSVKKMGLTDVILQVRPCADAFYPSENFPWSRFLTGVQGQAPGENFDPLAYWVQEAHKRGLSLHAWINPFRITIGGQTEISGLCDENPAILHPEFVVNYKENLYFDPGLPAVRQLITDGVRELTENYDIDGIQLDDYFYPGTDFPDDVSYRAYGKNFADRESWRRDNINQLIQQLDQVIHQTDPSLIFGVSPTGIWCNQTTDPRGSATAGSESRTLSCADSYTWVKEGWVDYICPQIYWERGHSQADYETLARWWADTVKDTDVRLYIGLAAYKAENADVGSPWYGTEELMEQLKLNRQIPNVSGVCFFRYGSLTAVDGLSQSLSDFYTQPTIPAPEHSDSLPHDLGQSEAEDGKLSLWQRLAALLHVFFRWLLSFTA